MFFFSGIYVLYIPGTHSAYHSEQKIWQVENFTRMILIGRNYLSSACTGTEGILIVRISFWRVLFLSDFCDLDPTLAGKKIAPTLRKAPIKRDYIWVPFVFWWALGAFDFPRAPTDVQSAHYPPKVKSAHFQYKPTLMVEHQKTENAHRKKNLLFLAHLQW